MAGRTAGKQRKRRGRPGPLARGVLGRPRARPSRLPGRLTPWA